MVDELLHVDVEFNQVVDEVLRIIFLRVPLLLARLQLVESAELRLLQRLVLHNVRYQRPGGFIQCCVA